MHESCNNCGFESVAQGECPVCGASTSQRRVQVLEWRTVHVARNPWEANLVRGYLEANDVPARVRDSDPSGRALGLAFSTPGVEVLIPATAYGRARAMLAATPCGGRGAQRTDTEFLELRAALKRERGIGLKGRAVLVLLAVLAAVTALACAIAWMADDERRGRPGTSLPAAP